MACLLWFDEGSMKIECVYMCICRGGSGSGEVVGWGWGGVVGGVIPAEYLWVINHMNW